MRTGRPRRHPRHLWRRRRLSALVLLVMITGAALAWRYYSADQRVRTLAIGAVERLSGGEVEIDGAQLHVLRQIRIKGFRLYLPGREHTPENLVLGAQDVILEHQFLSLFQRRLVLDRVVATSPQLNIWYDPQRDLTNLELLALFERPLQTGGPRPTVTLREAELTYREVHSGRLTRPVRQVVSGQIIPDPDEDSLMHFHFEGLPGSALGRSDLHGTYDTRTRELDSRGSFLLQAVDFASLPEEVERFRELYELSAPTGRVQTETRYEPGLGQVVDVTLAGGELKVPLGEIDIPLTDVEAQIRALPDGIEIERISGRYEDQCRFVVTGKVAGYSEQAPFDLRVQTQGLEIPADAWVEEPGEPGEAPQRRFEGPLKPIFELIDAKVRGTVAEFAPTGKYELDLRMRRGQVEGVAGPVEIVAAIEMRGGAIRAEDFPYLVSNLNGTIRMEPGEVTFGPLVANMGEHRVDIEGVYRPNAWRETGVTEFELAVRTERTPLDETLYAALRPWQRDFYDMFEPVGAVNASYRVQGEPNQPWHEELLLEFAGISARYREMPVRMDEVTGFLRYKQGRADFEVSQAQAASGTVALQGYVEHPRRRRPEFAVEIDFAGLGLDEEFGEALPGPIRELYRQVQFRGRASGQARLAGGAEAPGRFLPEVRTEPNDSMVYRIAADFEQGDFCYEGFPYSLSEASGRVMMTNSELKVEQLRARHGQSRLELGLDVLAGAGYRLEVTGDPLVPDEELREAMKGDLREQYDRWNPSGTMRLALELEERPGAASEAETDYVARIDLLDAAARPAVFAYPFTGLTGRVTVTPGQVKLEEVRSRPGGAEVLLTGTLAQGEASHSELSVTARRLELDGELAEAAPAGFAKVMKRLEPSGLADVDLVLSRSGTKSWQVQAGVSLSQAKFVWPYAIAAGRLELEGQGDYTPQAGAFNASGRLASPALTVEGRPVEALAARVTFNAADRRLALNNVRATLCRGRLAGSIYTWLTAEPAPYEIQLQLNDADLPMVLQEDKGKARSGSRGTLTGWLNASRRGAADSRRGSFLFVIRDAVLGQLPIAASTLHVLNVSLPREGAFNEAAVSGSIVGEQVVFDGIALRGSALALRGAGVMNPGRQLDLVFATESPHRLPEVPIISSFLRAISAEVAQVRVTGTWNDPEVESVALPSLDAALREFSTELPEPRSSD